MKKNYPYLDVLKIIMCVFVVMIHINPIGDSIYPWVRASVPMFFVISSFLFFIKNNILDKTTKNKNLIGFITRNLKLYLVWFLLLLPITLREKDYFNEGIKKAVLRFVSDLLFGSTFKASWFLMALIIGMVLIFLLSEKLDNRIVTFICIVTYYGCCMATNYANLASEKLIYIFKDMMGNALDMSFVASLIWLDIGKQFSKYENKIKPISFKKLFIMLAFSIISLYVEYKYTTINQTGWTNSHYFSLLLLVPIIFAITIKINDHLVEFDSKLLRVISTITYCMHYSFRVVISDISHLFGTHFSERLKFFIVIIVCFVFSTIVYKLSKKEKFKLLRILY